MDSSSPPPVRIQITPGPGTARQADWHEAAHPFSKYFHEKERGVLLNEFPASDLPFSILDAACGQGELIELLHRWYPEHRYYGLDQAELVQRAQAHVPFARLSTASLQETGYPNESFDVIFCGDVLEHIREWGPAISELKRILKSGGLLFISYPNESLWALGRFFGPVKKTGHLNFLTPRKIKFLTRLPLLKQVNLPFPVPFTFSLGCVMKFRKEIP